MKKIIFTCGVISGLISVSWVIFSQQVFKLHIGMSASLFFGYATMLLAFSLIFVGVKSFRDNHNNGVISFGKALQVALLITTVASTVYVAIWLLDYYIFIPDYIEKYAASMLAGLKASHASQAIIDQQTAEMTKYAKMYNNPLFNALFTYREIVPMGIVVSLITALILKNNRHH